MEVEVAAIPETNSVDSSASEVAAKEVKKQDDSEVESAVELEKNVTSDKELSWEKITAEVTDDDAENETQEVLEHNTTENQEAEVQSAGGEVQEVEVQSITQEEDVQSVSETQKVHNTVEGQGEEVQITIERREVKVQSTTDAPQSRSPGRKCETHVAEETVTVEKETVIKDVAEDKLITHSEVDEVIVDSNKEAKQPTVTATEEILDITTENKTITQSAELVEEIAVPVEEKVTEVLNTSDTIPVDEVIEVQDQPSEISPGETSKSTAKSEPEPEVEISELKPEEVTDAPETVSEVEYTVIDADDVETNEIIEEHIAQTTNNSNKTITETVVIINPDQSQTELTIEQVDDDEKNDESSQSYTEEIYYLTKDNEDADDPPKDEVKDIKPKKQRGRKPIADIPLHVLGRDISKPTEGVSNGGRTMPKPRLGVKVPYRNLTSQIVSKQEIEKEIMERFKLKQEQNITNSGDILFARKLTQRLAKKLIPPEKDKSEKGAPQEGSSSEKPPPEIKNNSDLIAILEGEGDDIELTKEKNQVREETAKQAARRTEKEIALEQLKELPGKSPKVFKTKYEDEKKVTSSQKEVPKPKPEPSVSSPQKPAVVKKQMEMEPRLKTGMVIKTYTRKRKSTEMDPIPPPKKTVVTAVTIKTEDGPSGGIYVTKSSRVIKRKVIWDPDEVPVKSPLKTPKVESPTKTPPVKVVDKKEPVEKILEKKVTIPLKKIIVKSSPIKKPKRLTEVEKLLMDEGAVNMLYDVKTNDDTSPDKLKKKSNKSVISLDKAHKELMSKTNVIRNDLQQNTAKDVQKSLRKKEIVSPTAKKEIKKEIIPSPVARKKSKDSVRSSVHSPPSSPPYNAAEASRIIRRHSSSSFSSNDELSDDGEEKSPKKKGAATESPKKKIKKAADAKPAKEVTKNNNNTVSEAKVNHVDKSGSQNKSFKMTKKNKLVAVKLQSVEGKCYLNDQVLKELVSCLKDSGKDDDCHVVSITSDSNDSFCEGLDYRLLVEEDEGARKKKASELASLVKEFLRCLLNFPKVLVAGIQGDCVGLGVTMLPLFDMVVASDTSTFSAPYARLGCAPEAGFLLTVPHLGNNGLASELLYTSQTIKADDAFRKGLVSRLCWPEKYQQELKSLVSQVANQSKQSIMATKQQLRRNILESTDSALSSVNKVLVECWTSSECQKNFAK